MYAAFTGQGALLLTACLPDPGAMLGLPGALARPLARRQRAVNAVVHALSDRYGAVHLHASEGDWTTDRAMWSADRLHPGERGHRQLALRFHALLAERGHATGPAPSPENEFPAPTRSASLWWLATAGTGWVARRCTDLLPQLLTLAADELRHHARGTSARLDLRTSARGLRRARGAVDDGAAGGGVTGGAPAHAGTVRAAPRGPTAVPRSADRRSGPERGPQTYPPRGRLVVVVRRRCPRTAARGPAAPASGPGAPEGGAAVPCSRRVSVGGRRRSAPESPGGVWAAAAGRSAVRTTPITG